MGLHSEDEDISAWLKEQRIAADLTQVELGQILGASPAAVASWENGERKAKPKKRKEMERILSDPSSLRERLQMQIQRGNRIVKSREQRGWTKRDDLANAAHVTYRVVSDAEIGNRVDEEDLRKMEVALGLLNSSEEKQATSASTDKLNNLSDDDLAELAGKVVQAMFTRMMERRSGR